MMKKLVKRVWRLCSKLNKWIERFSGFFNIIIIIIVVLICSQAIAFCIVYLQLLNEKEINMLCFRYINIWGILSLEEITNKLIYSNVDAIKTKIEFLMNTSIALSGILLSLVTFISYFRKNVDFRKKSCFRKKEIFNTGEDDIKIMCDYFSGANYVAIYSHSFMWLKNEKIREILEDLSNKNKLKLYTGDDINNVKTLLSVSYENSKLIQSIQESKVSLRFSYVERNNAKYLLYRQEEEKHIYVISVHENNESKYLLQVISQLVK